MKLPLLAGLLAAVFCTPAFSQAAAAESPLLVGKRYVETQFSYIDYKSEDDIALGALFNQPLNASFDAGVSFVHTQQEGNDSINYQVLGAHLAAHHDFGQTRAFARGTLYYEWWAVKNLWWYQIDAGFERALGDRVALTVYASWLDFLTSTFLENTFSGTARLTCWVTPDIALSAATSVLERGAIAYRLGFAYAF